MTSSCDLRFISLWSDRLLNRRMNGVHQWREEKKKSEFIYFFFKLAGDIIIETATAESPRLQRTVGFFRMKRLQASQF